MITSPLSGSPPRAWGGLKDAVVVVTNGRLTPTCVGRTYCHFDHLPSERLTPTCVGRTRITVTCKDCVPAHPHVRGEDQREGPGPTSRAGSPPRAWGGPQSQVLIVTASRLTPTCVGRTGAPQSCGRSTAAHPHVRGEDACGADTTPDVRGSPPRAWGGRQPDPKGANPLLAHPHVRGEDVAVRLLRSAASGSPPRAWGGPHPRAGQPADPRLTPTCVGRTSDRFP